MKSKNQKIGLLVLCVFVFSSILAVNNVKGFQTDDDLSLTLHGKLESNSHEVNETLMSLGDYNYWDTPNLDIGDYSHDYSSFEIKSLRRLFEKEINSENTIQNINPIDNNSYTANNQLEEYTTSGGFTTNYVIEINSSIVDNKEDTFSDNLETETWGSNISSNILTYNKDNYFSEEWRYVGGWNVSDMVYDNINQTVQGSYTPAFYFKPDGTKLYECGNAEVYQWNLSTPWDLNSISYYDSAGISLSHDIYFKPDGTIVYSLTLGEGNIDLRSYSLSTPWDITTYSYIEKIDVQDGNSEGMYFSYDGSKLYELGSSNTLYQYNLSTSWEISTASLVFNETLQDTDSSGMYFKSDGSKLYESGKDGDKIYQHSLTTPWDIRSLSYDNLYVSTQDSHPSDVHFSSNGTKMFELGYDSHKVYQYTSSFYNISKFYQNKTEGYAYVQTDTTETLNLTSPIHSNTTYLRNTDNITVEFETNNTNQINAEFYNNGNLVKTKELVANGNGDFTKRTVDLEFSEYVEFDQIKFTGEYDDTKYLKVYSIQKETDLEEKNIETAYISDFEYQVLGHNYTETYELWKKAEAQDGLQTNYTYHFNSSYFTERTLNQDVIIPSQNLTLLLYLTQNETITLTTSVNYNYTNWKVPTEVDFELNSQEITDESYNSGYTSFEAFQESLEFTANEGTSFQFNATSYFTFEFDLNVVSKTYLKRSFELLSDHSIDLERIDFDSDLDIKHVYFNNDDLGSANSISVSKTMNTNNIYTLEVILAEEMYLPLEETNTLNKSRTFGDWTHNYNEFVDSTKTDNSLNSSIQEGHYPATYSFTDEEIGDYTANPTDIEFVDYFDSLSSSDYSVSIVDNVKNHRDVLQIKNSDTIEFKNYFDSVSKGTMEFWLKGNNSEKPFRLFSALGRIYFDTGENNWDINSNSGWESNLGYCEPNRWEHLRIDFDQTIPEFSVYINGDHLGTWTSVSNTPLEYIRVLTYTNTQIEIDAIGYSWDSDYQIGDNLHWNNYRGSETFEQYNQTESGDYSGTDSFEYNMEEGKYYGSYDFNNETVGDYSSDPTQLGFYDDGFLYEDCYLSVEENVLGHSNVLNITDNNNAGNVRINQEFNTLTDAKFEFYTYTDQLTYDLAIRWFEDSNDILYLYLDGGDFEYYNGSNFNVISNYTSNSWYHHSVHLNDTNNSFDWYIDGVLEGNDLTYRNPSSIGVNKLIITTITSHSGYSYYFDAFGVVGETWSHGGLGYSEGWNINPYDITPLLNEGYDLGSDYDTSLSIENEVDGHNLILNLSDSSTNGNVYFRDYFSDKSSGIAEFWIYSNDTSKINQFGLYDNGKFLIDIRIQSDNLEYYDGSWNTLANINNDKWYHLKIDFTSSDWDCYLNGSLKGSNLGFYQSYTDGFDRIEFFTNIGQSNYFYLIDALGVVGEDGYKEGDNINLYGQDIIDDLESNGWTISNDPYTSVGIGGEFNSHKKFLNLTDNSDSNYIETYYNFESQTSGIVELYFKTSDVDKRFYPLYLMDSGLTIAVHLYIDDGTFYYYDGSSHSIDSTIQSNQWYSLKVDFDCSSDTYNIYLNSTLISGDTPFHNNIETVSKARFRTYSDSDYSISLDSLSFSWDSEYFTNYSQTKETLIGELLYSKINQSYTVDKDLGLNLNQITVSFEYKFEEGNGNFSSYATFNSNNNLNTNGSWIRYSVSYSNAFSLSFNISNGVLELRSFIFRETTAITQSEASTDNNSVIIKKAFYSYRAFKYWYLEDSLSINSLSLKHNRTGEIISDLSNESSRYFFEKDCQENDVFIATIDYDPNWLISYDFTQNNATYSNIEVQYKADFSIYNVSLILDLRNSNIFDNFGSNTRISLRLTIDDINFTSSTQTLYLEGFRTQLTSNPKISSNSVNFNETFNYNSELISQDTVDVNPHYQISSDYQNTNSTETNIQFGYKSDVPVSNVSYSPSLNIEGMFDNSWQLNNNFSSINFDLNPLNFTKTLQIKLIYANLTQITANPTTSIDSVYYNLKVYDASDILLTKSIDIDPGFSTDFSYYIANSMYSKIKLDYLANIYCKNVTHKISIDILQAFGNNWELNTNLTTYQITIDEIDFTDTINSLYISSNLTQITANPTTLIDSVDFRFKYYRDSNSNLLLQSDLDINPGWQVSYTVENSTTLSIAGKVRYKADLNVSNVDLHLNKKRYNMFNDLLTLNNNQNNNNVSLTLSSLSFTEVFQTTYLYGNRAQLNASARTDLDSVYFTETYTWNNSTLNSYTIDVDPNFYVSYDIIKTQSKYTKLKITYRADLTISNVSLILNLNDYCFGVNFTLVSTKITINELNFRSSSKYLYIEGYRTQYTQNPRTDQETVQFNETFYYSGNLIKTSVVSIDPQWQISYEILVNNGTYSKLRITYSSTLALDNVYIVLDLSNSSCYNENWTLSAYQDLDFILSIPNIDLTTQSQRIYIEGYSSIPYATITGFESDQNFNRLAIDEEVVFVAFLNFSKYSEIFLINISSNWECFYVFYPNDTYNVQYINDYQIQFTGKGFDPKVNSSYLYFKTKPFSTVNFTYANDTIEIVIYSEFDVNNSYFFYRFNDESNHELVILYNTTNVAELSDYGDYEGYLFFKCNNITKGYTVVVIYIDKADGIEFWIQAIPIFAVAGVSIAVFYYLKFNEKALEKVKSFVSEKVIDRLKKNEGQLENVKISQKGDEINIKFKN